MLDDDGAVAALADVLDIVARGAVPGGRLGDAAAALLVGALTPLAKANGDIRPIAVPESLRRILARAVASQFKDMFAEYLAPLQCGVGLPGGQEVMHKTACTFAADHPNHVFSKLDARNGYTSMWRSTCVDQASHDVPELAVFWSLCYARGGSHSRYVFRRDGQAFWILADAGVDQGDGLAPALFSFGLKRPAAALLAGLEDRVRQLGIEEPVLLLLYLDDILVAVPAAVAHEVLPLATAAIGDGLPGCPGAGLELAPDKSEAWCPAGGVRPLWLPTEVRWRTSGFVVLGAAVDAAEHPDALLELGLAVGGGAGGEAERHWRDAAAVAQRLLGRVAALHSRRTSVGDAQGEAVLSSAQCAQLLLRFCVEPKLLHLLRATPPRLILAGVSETDAGLQQAFGSFFGMASPPCATLAVQLALPVRHGGAGVGALGLKHEAAYVGSWALCLSAVLARLPAVDAAALQLALSTSDARHPTAGHVLAACTALEEAGVAHDRLPDWEACAARPSRRRQAALSRARVSSVRDRLLAALPEAEAARVRSCGGPGAGAWLVCPASEVAETELFDGPFSFGARWRFGLDTSEVGSRCQIGCQRRGGQPCGAAVDSRGDHAAICKCGGYKTIRHSRIVATLRRILRESGAAVSPTEVPVHGWRRADGTGARLDVAYWADGSRHYVDVTIRHPRAQKYRARAALVDGAAAAEAERNKRARYPASADAGLSAVEPFVLESFGRLGPAALQLLGDARQRVAERRGARSVTRDGVAHRWFALLQSQLLQAQHEAVVAMWGASFAPLAVVSVPFLSAGSASA